VTPLTASATLPLVVELRTQAGDVLTDRRAVDEMITPCRVQAVPVPGGIADLLDHAPLTDDEHARLLAHADPTVTAECTAAGWPPPLAQVFWPGMPDTLEQMVAGYAPPHTNPADEVHHVLAGRVQFGIVRVDGIQVLLTLGPGDAFHLRAGTEHWSVLSPERRLTAVVYLSLAPGFAHHYTGTAIRIT